RISALSFHCRADHPYLHSFPTRRSSDLAERMIEQAQANLTENLEGRVRFEVADASKLPYAVGSFDLVGLSNMIPFFDELDRVLRSEEHTSELQSRGHLVCRLLLEKKKIK